MTRFDDGEKRFSTTTTETASRAVAAVLKMGKEAENRELWVHDVVTCQNELLKLGKEIVPDAEWTVTPASTEDWARRVGEEDPKSRMADVMMKTLAIFGRNFKSDFEQPDNEELGIGTMGENEVKEVLRRFTGDLGGPDGRKDAALIARISSSAKEA